MKHFVAGLALIISFCHSVRAQQKVLAHIYDPKANAKEEIQHAVAIASKEHKHVFLQIGGNWCIWCVRFNNLVNIDTTLTRIMNENYIVLHVNYSEENKNQDVMKELGYPGRFGYPVFVILDDNGNRIHTQNSAYLEEGAGHSRKKVEEFLKQWTYAAIHPDMSKN